MIRRFMTENKLNEDSLMGQEVLPLLASVEGLLAKAKLRADAQLLTIFTNLRVGLVPCLFNYYDQFSKYMIVSQY